MRVGLADAGDNPDFRIGEGLPPSARSLLSQLGVLPRVLSGNHRVSPGTLAWWGTAQPHANDFVFQLQGNGLQLDRTRFDATLRDAAREAGAIVLPSARIRLANTATPFRLTAGTTTIETEWLIDATGRSAGLGRMLGAERRRYDGLVAFYGLIHSDADTDRDGRTMVETTEAGWWYSVLLPRGDRVLAFLTDADLADRTALLADRGLWHALRAAPNLHALCTQHGYSPTGRVFGTDAASSELVPAAGVNWLAVGDAAAAFDPLSSKGISNALYTGIKGAEAILAARGGNESAIPRYAEHIRDIHRVYRGHLVQFYRMERRWPDAPFWGRRMAAPE